MYVQFQGWFLAGELSNLRKMETRSKLDMVQSWNYLQVQLQDCTKREEELH